MSRHHPGGQLEPAVAVRGRKRPGTVVVDGREVAHRRQLTFERFNRRIGEREMGEPRLVVLLPGHHDAVLIHHRQRQNQDPVDHGEHRGHRS